LKAHYVSHPSVGLWKYFITWCRSLRNHIETSTTLFTENSQAF